MGIVIGDEDGVLVCTHCKGRHLALMSVWFHNRAQEVARVDIDERDTRFTVLAGPAVEEYRGSGLNVRMEWVCEDCRKPVQRNYRQGHANRKVALTTVSSPDRLMRFDVDPLTPQNNEAQ